MKRVFVFRIKRVTYYVYFKMDFSQQIWSMPIIIILIDTKGHCFYLFSLYQNIQRKQNNIFSKLLKNKMKANCVGNNWEKRKREREREMPRNVIENRMEVNPHDSS